MDEELARLEEEKKKNMPQVEIHGAGAEKLSQAKDRFEKFPNEPVEVQKEAIEVNRSEAEKRRVQKTFNQQVWRKECPVSK